MYKEVDINFILRKVRMIVVNAVSTAYYKLKIDHEVSLGMLLFTKEVLWSSGPCL